jgi:hypothetical protein
MNTSEVAIPQIDTKDVRIFEDDPGEDDHLETIKIEHLEEPQVIKITHLKDEPPAQAISDDVPT